MKKIIFALLGLFLLSSCENFFEQRDCACFLGSYTLGFVISLEKVKDPSVKSIKVVVENTDKIKPKYVSNIAQVVDGVEVDDNTGIGNYLVVKREKKSGNYGFVNVKISPDKYPDYENWTIGKYRDFKLEVYKNDVLFLTKKMRFLTTKVGENHFTDKVEVDNRDYVKQINVRDMQGSALVIEIPDKPKDE